MTSGLYMLSLSVGLLMICMFFYSIKYRGKFKLSINDITIVLFYVTVNLSSILFLNGSDGLKVSLYFVSILYMIIVGTFLSMFYRMDKTYIIKTFKIALIIYGGSIIFQNIVYFLSKEYIDFFKYFSFGNSESRYLSKTFQEFGLIRSTSFFSEPSNASAVVSMLAFCYMIITNKIDKYVIFGLFSSMLTLSSAGVLIGAITLVLIILFDSGYFKSKTLKYITAIFVICSLYYILALTVERIFNNNEYDMLLSRSTILYMISDMNTINHIFGNGIKILSSPLSLYNYTVHDYTIRDSGFILNLYFSVGIIGMVIFLLFIKKQIKRKLFIVILFVLLQSKFDYLQPVFWMVIFTISKDIKNLSKHC
ncbi:hypothetical protein [Photobacterium damselae]|uniref:hypothetical protein n=1 Tax=Photobacterium damselae TaxID=38293 RepID=UPI001245E271|nr:hypothetical protein [Photobacterium damselae]KAB1182949.1 hypothetical protein F6477_01540 [Photobacterium damselae subsp. damselae]MBF7101600.1 hypothetical protein [Photobacterium damselae]